MRWTKLAFILTLILGLGALALEPAELHARLDKFRTVDRSIDNEIKLVGGKLEAGQISLAQAHALWLRQLARAQQNGEDVRALQDLADDESLPASDTGEVSDELASMCDLVRQQQGRIQLLVDASKLEIEQGPQAAAEMYQFQAESLEMYLQTRERVDDLFEKSAVPVPVR